VKQVIEWDRPTPSRASLTDDPVEILQYAHDSLAVGVRTALVTLTEIRGGAARSLGSQMAVREDGLYCGFVSGGCTESAVAAEAVEALRIGCDRFVLLGEGSPFFDIVLPCGGGISLSVHLLRNLEPIVQILEKLAVRLKASLEYSPAAESLCYSNSKDFTGWSDDKFIINYEPETRLVLCGGSVELATTQRVAEAAGYNVVIYGGRGRDFPSLDEATAVVMLYHDLDIELPVLKAALRARPFYIGALGSHRTHERRAAALRALGFKDIEIARIKAPIGIFPKARDASSIALSVLADVASARTLTRQRCISQSGAK
jgi:xanthine dehydrogenase accessory factor